MKSPIHRWNQQHRNSHYIISDQKVKKFRNEFANSLRYATPFKQSQINIANLATNND